jgi:hypothetical protein
MAQAVTYRTGEAASKLRTVLVDDLREVTLLAAGLKITTGHALCGLTTRCDFWTDELEADYHGFAVPSSQITQIRQIGPVKARKVCR